MNNSDFIIYLLVCIFIVAVVTMAIVITQYYLLVDAPAMPHCQEDELVIGWGDYSQGYYEDYHCRAIDDIGMSKHSSKQP